MNAEAVEKVVFDERIVGVKSAVISDIKQQSSLAIKAEFQKTKIWYSSL